MKQKVLFTLQIQFSTLDFIIIMHLSTFYKLEAMKCIRLYLLEVLGFV